jgi:hypothetical protein
MFINELQEENLFKSDKAVGIKLLLMDVYFIARHTWEFVDKNGKLKNGDDLHKAWPLMYEGKEMMSTEELFKNIRHFPSLLVL